MSEAIDGYLDLAITIIIIIASLNVSAIWYSKSNYGFGTLEDKSIITNSLYTTIPEPLFDSSTLCMLDIVDNGYIPRQGINDNVIRPSHMVSIFEFKLDPKDLMNYEYPVRIYNKIIINSTSGAISFLP